MQYEAFYSLFQTERHVNNDEKFLEWGHFPTLVIKRRGRRQG